MSFECVKGHRKAIDILQRQLKKKRIPSGYLFCGPRGVGKTTTAVAFACALCCPTGGDDDCVLCKRIREKNFPDVEIIDYEWQINAVPKIKPSERKTIGIDAIKELQNRVVLKPMEGTWKIYIIDRADTMTMPAANSFLKILEEPPKNTVFILTADNEFGILPTIRSRCQIIRFGYISKKEFSIIIKKPGISPQDAYLLCDGSPGAYMEWGPEGIEDMAHIEPLWEDIMRGDTLEVLSTAQREYNSRDEIEYLIGQLLLRVKKLFKQDHACWHDRIQLLFDARADIRKNVNARLVRDVLLIHLSRGFHADCSRN